MEFNRVNKKYSNYQSGKWVWPLQIRNLLLSSIWCLRYASWRKWIFLRRAAVSAKSAVSATFRLNWVGSAGRCRCFAARAHMFPSSIVVFKTSSPKAVLTHLHQAASTQRLRDGFEKGIFFNFLTLHGKPKIPVSGLVTSIIARTKDAQRGKIFHCRAENSLPLTNFLVAWSIFCLQNWHIFQISLIYASIVCP